MINRKIAVHFSTAARCAAALMLVPIAIAATSAAASAAATDAAQGYPARPIRLVVPNSPGSGADVVSRLVAGKLTESLGRQVVIDNRAGAGGAIGSQIAAAAAADGYTLLMITSEQAIVSAMYEKPGFDLVNEFSGISLLATTPLILAVTPSLPVTSTAELIALAKGKPGQLNYGSAGTGTTSHLAAELFKSMTGTSIVHVPYKGTGPAVTDNIAGHVQVSMLAAAAVISSIRSGKLRALGITGAKRAAIAPDLPTIGETVPGYQWGGWYGLAVPRGTPRQIIAKLNAELVKAIKSADLQEKLMTLTVEPLGTPPEEFEAHIRAQIEKMRLVIKVSGARRE
jgi:tripartite-type tricarboxylate transporter receptor subunit TctC